jgi:hypothetical protein
MGSSTSKPRKGHKNPKHLPKVGTPANREWEHEGRQQQVFGSGPIRIVIAVLVIAAIIGLILITL